MCCPIRCRPVGDDSSARTAKAVSYTHLDVYKRQGLSRYLMHRQEMRIGGDHVFVSDEGQPLVYWRVHDVFRILLKSAGIKPSRGRWPRIHELRHTFAVRALESSPTDRQRIGQHMLALATYLGHVNINSTYWYLETTPELLRGIAVVTENFVQGGQP